MYRTIANWLETRWVAPAYSGWLMGGLALFFFAAATNTMAGWLYVISGVMAALLAIAARLPERSLRGIEISRASIQPVSAGEPLAIELLLTNRSNQVKTLLQVRDLLPFVLSEPANTAIEAIPAQGSYRWIYHQPTAQRGIYSWDGVELRTATPLGLFWCRRRQTVSASAVVYPIVLPLSQCPILDEIGKDLNPLVQSDYRSQMAVEGLTRTLRPYRWGDPIRLVHWRTSARYGELRVRELETYTGGQELVIGLDSTSAWSPEAFEQAVIAAASLYFYALHHQLPIQLWTAATGLVRGAQPVLEALAATQPSEVPLAEQIPDYPVIWLTQSPDAIQRLTTGSRWLLWTQASETAEAPGSVPNRHSGWIIEPDQPLSQQLQAASTYSAEAAF